ncbi:MAG: hypothetical protein QM770_07545 [Tepidisphaeraceae bacterium]
MDDSAAARNPLVSRRTQAHVNAYLREHAENFFAIRSEDVSVPPSSSVENAIDFHAALEEAISTAEPAQAAVAACFLINALVQRSRPLVTTAAFQKATARVKVLLADDAVRGGLIFLMTVLRLTELFANELFPYLKSNSREERHAVAAALLKSSSEDVAATGAMALVADLKSAERGRRLSAAALLLAHGNADQRCEEILQTDLRQVEHDDAIAWILSTVAPAIPQNAVVRQLCVELALVKSSSVARQLASLDVLLAASHDRDEIVALAQSALNPETTNATLIVAISTLFKEAAAGHVICDALRPLIAHTRDEIRFAAANAIFQMDQSAEVLIHDLVDQFLIESNTRVVELQASALVAIGPLAVPALMNLLTSEDMQRVVAILNAISRVRSDAAEALANVLQSTPSGLVRMFAAEVLIKMGQRALPAIPVVANLLNTVFEDDLQSTLLLTITACGSDAIAAIPALIQYVADNGVRDSGFTNFALVALLNMRVQALPVLQSECESAVGQAKENLTHALGVLTPAYNPDFADFERLGNDRKIRVFIEAGSLIEHEELTWAEIARRMEPSRKPKASRGKPGQKKVQQPNKRIADQRARRAFSDIQSDLDLKEPLCETAGSKGRQRLTRQGAALLRRARAYVSFTALKEGKVPS